MCGSGPDQNIPPLMDADDDGGFEEHIRTRLREQIADVLFFLSQRTCRVCRSGRRLTEDTENHKCLNSDPAVVFDRFYELACDIVYATVAPMD